MMERGINFRSEESQIEYFDAYEKTMQLFPVRVADEYVDTEFGKSYVIKCGNALCLNPSELAWIEHQKIVAAEVLLEETGDGVEVGTMGDRAFAGSHHCKQVVVAHVARKKDEIVGRVEDLEIMVDFDAVVGDHRLDEVFGGLV